MKKYLILIILPLLFASYVSGRDFEPEQAMLGNRYQPIAEATAEATIEISMDEYARLRINYMLKGCWK